VDDLMEGWVFCGGNLCATEYILEQKLHLVDVCSDVNKANSHKAKAKARLLQGRDQTN